ncbi:MAG TPA: peptide chain release factor 3 [Ruminococcaceae bacterium]|nr:peptide chain release factor 3 [Oscillospiraceae bacterium]
MFVPQNTELAEKIHKRRTFAIISHPDAGKTTLTEKLLLYGGAIRLAGAVKGRKAERYAVSDWMEIEKQRGISVTSSVMQFDYDDYHINILDTPGHQDFSEDTYRTLVAADSAVMLIDGAKGIEAQTIKLFHVCRMRGIPIFTFVNKMDRFAKDPFDLMEELEKVLGIRSCPMNWPIGSGTDFRGVYNRAKKRIELFTSEGHGQKMIAATTGAVDDPQFKELLGEKLYAQLCEEIELLDTAGDAFDLEKVKKGELTPMYFGSAMTNFGVQTFLEDFLSYAPAPVARDTDEGPIDPTTEDFSGFVFKIQANMNPAHRDRIAFIRICSGKFEKEMNIYQTRTKKNVRLSQPQQFLAQDRNIVKEAYAGDIIGVFDPGIFKIGDTLCPPGKVFHFAGIPMFPAEHFAEVTIKDAMKRKQFLKGVEQIAEEGAIQLFKQANASYESLIVGVVGVLQFEVLEYRLKNEYRVDVRMDRLPYGFARWVTPAKFEPGRIGYTNDALVVQDSYGRQVALFTNEWFMQRTIGENGDVEFLEIPPTPEE